MSQMSEKQTELYNLSIARVLRHRNLTRLIKVSLLIKAVILVAINYNICLIIRNLIFMGKFDFVLFITLTLLCWYNSRCHILSFRKFTYYMNLNCGLKLRSIESLLLSVTRLSANIMFCTACISSIIDFNTAAPMFKYLPDVFYMLDYLKTFTGEYINTRLIILSVIRLVLSTVLLVIANYLSLLSICYVKEKEE